MKRCALILALLLILLTMVPQPLAMPRRAAAEADANLSHRWLKIETHVHSAFSADAVADVGVLAAAARRLGYDAVFLTDHNEGSAYQIDGHTANRRTLDEDDRGWKVFRRGVVSTSAATMENDTAYQGVRAFRLALSSPSAGTIGLWARRGPLVTAGPVILSFAVLVRHFDPETGFAATVSLGGDPEIGSTIGYTTASGEVLLDRGVTFAWTIGNPVFPASEPTQRVIVFPLPEPRANEWTVYTVDVTAALAQLPVNERPHPFAAFLYPTLRLSAHAGSADLSVDAVVLEAQRPLPPADEFVARSQPCHTFSSDSFRVFCAQEMGQQRHTIRFDFAIEHPEEFTSFRFGTDGIPLVHNAGYPAQLNHPGSTVRLSEIREERAYGADFIEVRKPEWAALWDELLLREVPLLGSWGTDSHELIDPGNPATFVFARTNSLDAIVSALYEGRTFLARNTFPGALRLRLTAESPRPYPARYPIFVSDQAATSPVFLSVPDGIPVGTRLRWIRNGQPWQEHLLTSAQADVTIDLPLDGPLTVLRAALLDRNGTTIAMTQPLVFRDVRGLPAFYRLRIEGIATSTGRGLTVATAHGIVAADWDPVVEALLVTLSAPAAARVSLALETDRPTALDLAGIRLLPPQHDPPLVLDLVQPHSMADLVIVFAHQPRVPLRPLPSSPAAVTVTAVERTSVTLSWQPPAERDRPLRYVVERNGKPLAFVGAATSYSDHSTRPGSRYVYAVRALDLAGARSEASAPLTVSVPPPTQLADDFESDSLASWRTVGAVSIQERSGESDNRALRLDLQSAPTAALRSLPAPQSALTIRFRFQLLDQGTTPVQLVALVDASGNDAVTLRLSSAGRLELAAGSAVVMGRQPLGFGVWYHCHLEVSPHHLWSASCHDAATPASAAETLTIAPAQTACVTIVLGQTSGTPRASLLIDDLVVRSSDGGIVAQLRPWEWETSRGRS